MSEPDQGRPMEGEGNEGYKEKEGEEKGEGKVREEEEEQGRKEGRPRWPPREDVLPDIEFAMKSRIRSAARKLMEDFEITGEVYEKQIMNSIAKGMSREGLKVFQPKKKLLLRSMGRGSFFAEEDRFYESSEDEASFATQESDESIDFFEDVEEQTNSTEKAEEEFAGEEGSNEQEDENHLSSDLNKDHSESLDKSEFTKVSEEPSEKTESTAQDLSNEQLITEEEVQKDGPEINERNEVGEEMNEDEVIRKEIGEVNTDEEVKFLDKINEEQIEGEEFLDEHRQEKKLRMKGWKVDEDSTAYPETTTRSTFAPSAAEETAFDQQPDVEGQEGVFKSPRPDGSPWGSSESSSWNKHSSCGNKKKKEKRRLSWITLACSGQTRREELGYASGWTEQGDDELSAGGRAAVEEAGQELLRRGSKFDMVITSSLAVDRETTNLLLYSVGQDSIRRYTTWELNPRHLGDLEGTTLAGTASRWGWLSGEVWAQLGPPKMSETHPEWYRQAEGKRQTGESLVHLQARTKRIWEFAERLLRKGKRSVLLVSRKPVTCALLLHALGLQPTDMSDWSPSPSVPLLFSFELKGQDMGLAAVEPLTEDTRTHCIGLFRAMLERYVDFGVLDKYGMAEVKRRYEQGRKLPTIDDIYRYKRAEAGRLFESLAGEVGERHRLLGRLADLYRGSSLAERLYRRIEGDKA